MSNDASLNNLERLFSPNLSEERKKRLSDSLNQFRVGLDSDRPLYEDPTARKSKWSPKIYTDFYLHTFRDHFLQGDVLHEIRYGKWDLQTKSYIKEYTDALIISNSCDISAGNAHGINVKQPLFAPVTELSGFISHLNEVGYSENEILNFELELKNQTYSNLMHLPPFKKQNEEGSGLEYIVWLDRIFTFPIEELHSYLDDVDRNKLCSLDSFGYYLFVIKLAYHLNRLPEEFDRL